MNIWYRRLLSKSSLWFLSGDLQLLHCHLVEWRQTLLLGLLFECACWVLVFDCEGDGLGREDGEARDAPQARLILCQTPWQKLLPENEDWSSWFVFVAGKLEMILILMLMLMLILLLMLLLMLMLMLLLMLMLMFKLRWGWGVKARQMQISGFVNVMYLVDAVRESAVHVPCWVK